jgi:hypothetical protein
MGVCFSSFWIGIIGFLIIIVTGYIGTGIAFYIIGLGKNWD